MPNKNIGEINLDKLFKEVLNAKYSGKYFLIQWKPLLHRQETFNIGTLFIDENNNIKEIKVIKDTKALSNYLIEKIEKEDPINEIDNFEHDETENNIIFQLNLTIDLVKKYISLTDFSDAHVVDESNCISPNVVFWHAGYAQGETKEEIINVLEKLL